MLSHLGHKRRTLIIVSPLDKSCPDQIIEKIRAITFFPIFLSPTILQPIIKLNNYFNDISLVLI